MSLPMGGWGIRDLRSGEIKKTALGSLGAALLDGFLAHCFPAKTRRILAQFTLNLGAKLISETCRKVWRGKMGLIV